MAVLCPPFLPGFLPIGRRPGANATDAAGHRVLRSERRPLRFSPMMAKSRLADLLARTERFEPVIAGIRAARIPAWKLRTDHDDRHLITALAATLGESSNAVDVGAASGVVLAEIVRLAPNGRHVAFEPRAEAAHALAQHYPSVEVRQAAASDRAGTTEFTVVRNIPELSGFSPRPWPHHELQTKIELVATEVLDEVITHRVDVLKIDVEAAEAACIRGAQRLLKRWKPLVAFEHGGTVPGDSGADEHREIWEILASAGLRVFTIDGDGPLSLPAFAEVSSSGAIWNFIARAA